MLLSSRLLRSKAHAGSSAVPITATARTGPRRINQEERIVEGAAAEHLSRSVSAASGTSRSTAQMVARQLLKW